MISQYDYYCPKCDEKLSENNQVLFHIHRSNKGMVKLYLDPKPRSYNFRCEPKTDFAKGEIVNFSCPHCQESLESGKYEKFVEILLKITDKVFLDVFFSRVFGDHQTFVGIEDFEEEYGHKIAS